MRDGEVAVVEGTLGRRVRRVRGLAGGFSHETSLVTADGEAVVVRAGGTDPAIEAAVMGAARRIGVPVPEVLRVVPPGDGTRAMMLVEFVPGTSLEEALTTGGTPDAAAVALGGEVGRVLGRVSRVRLDRPGFFADAELRVRQEVPWSRQLADVAAGCMARVGGGRLDDGTRRRWVRLCAAHAPALARVDGHARLVHADANPKNILVTRVDGGWRVAALLDWEFAYAGCPYGDAANMTRFAADHPAVYVNAFRAAFAAALPRDLSADGDWPYLGAVLDMFALSDLVTRPPGNPIADRAADRIRDLVAGGLPA